MNLFLFLSEGDQIKTHVDLFLAAGFQGAFEFRTFTPDAFVLSNFLDFELPFHSRVVHYSDPLLDLAVFVKGLDYQSVQGIHFNPR